MRTPTTTIDTVPCLWCGVGGTVTVPVEGYTAYVNGESIQQALYDVDASQREMLISGTHPGCWDVLWAEMEEEDDGNNIPPF